MTINTIGTLGEHKTFKGFTKMSDNLNRKENFIMANGGKLIAKVPLSWKKSFSQGVRLPHKMKKCGVRKKDTLCDECDKLVKQKKGIFT